jgi:aryl-alcohol dehydrogenase-like predicted oxidoreductase
MSRQHEFSPDDQRLTYPMYQGQEWQKNQDFLDQLREVAADAGRTVAQVVINWTIHRPGVTVALCGAKRAYQIEETAGAMDWQLGEEQLDKIDAALEARGTALSRRTL